MNKQELIDNIAASADITKAAAARALDSVIDSVTNSLKKMILLCLLVLGLFRSVAVRLERDETPKLDKRFRLLRRRCQHSRQVRLLRMQ